MEEHASHGEILITTMFSDEIRSFFEGTLPASGFIEGKGKVRIVNHKTIETLEVEPIGGGQYSIAVRAPLPPGYLDKDKTHTRCKYMGYIVGDYYLVGINTGGH